MLAFLEYYYCYFVVAVCEKERCIMVRRMIGVGWEYYMHKNKRHQTAQEVQL
jgi:hypothetical protein